MKQIILFLAIVAQLGIGQLAAQTYEYVPFVREGVKWVCLYDNPIQGMGYEDGFIPFGVHYYTLEMKGDTMINGKAYKPVHLYSGESIDESNDTVPVYVREEDKVVYGIIPDERRYWECPVGIGTMVINCSFAGDHIKAGEEFKLYDFSDPANFYENEVTTVMPPLHYNYADTVQVGNRLSKRHSISFNSSADHEDFIIEGIGYVGNDDYRPLGTPLNYFYPVSTGMTQVDYRLSHVIEDGQIVYKTSNYKEPESADYVPFVREGVKWVYYYENPVYGMDYQQGYIPGGRYFYSMEMKGDTVINGKSYKPVHVSGIDLNQEMVPVYLREENKVVYGIIPDERRYWECPVGIGTSVDNGRFCNDKIEAGVEFKLYDFGDPANFYENEVECSFIKPKYNQVDTVQVGNRLSLRHSVSFGYDEGYFIEGLGYVGNSVGPVVGTPLDYFYPVSTGMTQVAYRLSHVIEDGSVVYKTSSYMEPMPGYYEYVPLVREGVKWVYYYDNPFDREVLGMDEGIQYYSFEVKGEVQIGDKRYKPVVLSHYVDGGKVVEDFVPVYLREEDKIVYAICPDGILHPECPVGRHGQINGSSPLTITDEEFVLYDFNDANSFIIEDFIWGGGLLYVGNRKVKSYQCCEDDMVIETIGYDGPHGMPLFFFSNNGGKHVDYRLSHVLEDGEIIYKGQYYNPDTHVGIDEVAADRVVRPADGNYYNLMGQPMGKDMPTVPGIYIHQGKKIVVR